MSWPRKVLRCRSTEIVTYNSVTGSAAHADRWALARCTRHAHLGRRHHWAAVR